MTETETEQFRFRDEGAVSVASTAEIITRVYDWTDSNDDSLHLSPVIGLKSFYSRPEYHNVIYSRIAAGGDVNQRRREALLRLDLGPASPLDIPLSGNESAGVTSIGLPTFNQSVSNMLSLPVTVTIRNDGGGLLYTCAEERITLSSSDVLSCLLKRRELGAVPLHSIPSAAIEVPAADHLLPSPPMDETAPLTVGAAPDDHEDRETTVRQLLSFNDPSFDLTPSELSRQHQPRGPLQAVEDYLQSKIGMYQWANTATPLTNEAQTFASPLLISDCMLVGILRRAGAALENPSIFPTLRKVIASFLTQTLQTLPLHEHTETGRPPVWITNDVMHNCLRNAHLDVYGHGGVAGVRFVLCTGIKRVLASVHPGVLLSGPSLSVMHDMIVDCIDRLVRAGLQHSYCVSSTGLVVHVPAGPMNTTSGHYNTDETVDLVLEAHQVPHGAVASTVPTRTLNSHAIQTAILQCMSPQLAKFAVSEGNNCIMKLSHHGYADLISTTATSLDSRCGLEFSVPYVAMITKKVHDVTLTVEGAAFLTAACQFLCAEILVLSGNYAVDSGITMLDARSIMLAVHNDEELKKFFPNPIAGAGGVSMMHGAVVQIQNALPVDDVEGEENEDEERYLMGLSKTSFEYMLLKKMKGAGGLMVDPRTGRHCTIAPMVGMVSVPEFDAACGSDAQTRAAVASALLSPAERAVMDHSRQTLKHSFVGRILQIRKMQGDDCTSCLDAAKFAIGVYDLLGTKLFPSISNRLCCLLTADALIHLRDATEAYMLSLLSDAVLAMCTNGRKIFEDKDLILTLRMKNIQL